MIRRAAAAAALLLLAVAASASGATGSLVGVHPLAGDESWVELALEPGASARTGARWTAGRRGSGGADQSTGG